MNTYNLKDTEQEVLNQSFDPTYKVLAVELLAENQAGTALNRLKSDASGNLNVNLDMATEGLATETTLAKLLAPAGAVTDTSVTLTSASTAYAVPAVPPTSKYALYIYNASDTDMFWRLSTGTTLGIVLPAGQSMTKDMNASQSLYFYCGSAGKVLNESHEVI